MVYKIKKPAEIYLMKDGKFYYLGTTDIINEVERFKVKDRQQILSSYKVHDVFKDDRPLVRAERKLEYMAELEINQTIVSKNYIIDINTGDLVGFRYLILEKSSLQILEDKAFNIYCKNINRQEKIIYL